MKKLTVSVSAMNINPEEINVAGTCIVWPMEVSPGCISLCHS